MKIMTFNLQNDYSIITKKSSFSQRMPSIIKIINDNDPDIIGVQEMTSLMKKTLTRKLNKYHFVGKSRYSKNITTNEHNDILIKKNIDIIENRTFWLSESPQHSGSRFKLSIFPRICTCSLISINGQKLRIYNTHLDHLFKSTRNNQLTKLTKIMKMHNQEIPAILMGDFNATISSSSIEKFESNNSNLISIYKKLEPSFTHHNKNGESYFSKEPIDYIYVSYKLKQSKPKIIKDKPFEVYPSDHYPLIVDIEFINSK